MRIVAGAWRGRRLSAPPGDALRPTADRVKEALFDILGPRVVDAVVVDLCCGAGGLGLEALSRGAERVHFVDRSSRSLDFARRNAEHCGADAERAIFVREDCLRWLERRLASGAAWDLLLADPPYVGGLAGEIRNRLVAAPRGAAPVLAVIEHSADVALAPAAGWRIDARRYGATILSFLEVDDV